MENKKQTAVEWLEKQFIKLESTIGVHGVMYELIEQAKQMEKQQIMDSHIHGHNATSSSIKKYDAEQYYNQKYGKKTDNN